MGGGHSVAFQACWSGKEQRLATPGQVDRLTGALQVEGLQAVLRPSGLSATLLQGDVWAGGRGPWQEQEDSTSVRSWSWAAHR